MTLLEVFETSRTPPPASGWRAFAACRGQGPLFFAGDVVSQAIAVAICRTCGVLDACRADVMATESPDDRFGIVAGLTARQRDISAG